MSNSCFSCNEKGHKFHGYIICDSCKKKLRLFTDETVRKYVMKFTKSKYEKEIRNKLISLEKNTIKQKIKLLDILTKLE